MWRVTAQYKACRPNCMSGFRGRTPVYIPRQSVTNSSSRKHDLPMQLAFIILSMLMACAWLGYSVAPVFNIVPADSVGAGSSYWIGPGLGMFLVALVSILLPAGIFGRRLVCVIAGLLLTASIAISPWLYIGRDLSQIRPWLHVGTMLLIVVGARSLWAWPASSSWHEKEERQDDRRRTTR